MYLDHLATIHEDAADKIKHISNSFACLLSSDFAKVEHDPEGSQPLRDGRSVVEDFLIRTTKQDSQEISKQGSKWIAATRFGDS